MVVEPSTCNGDGMICAEAVPCLKSEVVNNGFANGIVNDVAEGSSGESLRTYKRRKHAKSESKGDGSGSVEAASQLADQISDAIRKPSGIVLQNNSSEQASVPMMDCHATVNGSNDCPCRHWRNVVLENMYQSLSESEGGIQGCIRDALAFHAQNDCTTTIKPALHFNGDRHKCLSLTGWMPSESPKAADGHQIVTSNGSLNESNRHTITKLCQRTFFDIIVSEKFAALCKLLSENFQGIKVDSFFDYSLINKRMEEGAYERSPELFSLDIQQVWRKLQRIGTDMVSLAKSLSDMSRTSYCEQVGGLVDSTSEDGRHEFCMRGSDCHTKPEQPEICGIYKLCACRHCGEKADGRDCLVCDSCEEMYHVSCIKPAVKEIPPKTWYCANCIASGIDLPHENCVVCERLNAPRSLMNEVGDEVIPTNEETIDELEGSNHDVEDGLQFLKGSKNFCCCKVCGSEVKTSEKLRTCEHLFCPNKYYHTRCLTKKQLKSYGPRWYCPSCLCRVCLGDRDDDKIVLCDGCDYAYHLYCMKPPLTSIPRRKWFCKKCQAGIKEIRKAKRAYETFAKKQKKEGEEGRSYENLEKKQENNGEELVDKAEGVDMLLTAANTLIIEEKLAAIQKNS